MDTTPIYELRERLRAAAMAGTNLLSEDFRLRRTYEAFQPLEKASPVFAKIGQLTGQLLSPECQNPQGALLDTITLVDAVICTLGAVDVAGEVETAGVINTEENAGNLIINAPYSTLKELLEALTTSGGGHFGYVCDIHDNHPELFKDYRVKYALVQALGAPYAELADKVEQWMIEENDRTILPALYRDFDPKGKREMARRVQVISSLAGADANDFYVAMLDGAQKDVRMELLDALRHEPKNLSLLFDLSKTEKGKNKDKVFELLAGIQDEKVEDYFRELSRKKPEAVLKYLRNSTTDWSAELVAGICGQMSDRLDAVDSASEKEKQELAERLQDVVRAIFGKGGAQICACYKELLARKEKIDSLCKEVGQKSKGGYDFDVLKYGVLTTPALNWYKKESVDTAMALGRILHHSLIVNPDADLQELALELYEDKNFKKSNIKFLSAAVTVKFSRDENCVDWLEEQVTDKVLLVAKHSKERMKAVTEAAAYVMWDSGEGSYALYGSYREGSYRDIYSTDYKRAGRPIRLQYARELTEWMIKHSSQEVDMVLEKWTALNDEEMCRAMGEYFYQRALAVEDNRGYLPRMKTCGWSVCKGLAVHFFKCNPKWVNQWQLQDYVKNMPGGLDARMEEARTLSGMMKTGELKQGNTIVASFDAWIEEQR